MRTNGIDVARVAVGAACAIFDDHGSLLLVRHTYGRLNWELPGGASEPGESQVDTARRELLEETGLEAIIEHLTGVYFEVEPEVGLTLHFVFRCQWGAHVVPKSSSAEIADVEFWPLDKLPTRISDFTERRMLDALTGGPTSMLTVGPRRWRS